MLLTDLNDDCLEHILKFLPLEAQLVIKNLCRRFELVIKSIWRRESKKVCLTYEQLIKFRGKNGNQQLLEYMTTIVDVVEQLDCDRINVEQLRMLDSLNFPKVKTLNCNLWNDNCRTNDQDTLLIAKLFPALTKLTLLSTITGQHLWLLEHLTDLDLSCCEFLKTKHFTRIFTTLKLRKFGILYYGYNTLLDDRILAITRCDTMEELKIDDHNLLLIIDPLLRMPTMRKIVCYTRDYDDYLNLLGKIADAVGTRMETMIYNDVFWSNDKHVGNLLKMPQLQKLILHDDDVRDAQLHKLAGNLHNLRDLTLAKVRLESEQGILSVVEKCVRLQVLNVMGTIKLSSEFLERLSCAVEKQSKRRTIPLELRCYGTPIARHFSGEVQLPSLLKVSVKEHDIELPCSHCFQCEWQPRGG